MSRKDDTLPHELILSIQRILDIHAGPDADPLDDLSDDFNPVGILNGIFPNGVSAVDELSQRTDASIEESLGQLETVQTRLAQNERDLQQEIKALQEELRKEQDPSRMQLIQEMISVSCVLDAASM